MTTEQVETWKSNIKGRIGIFRLDGRGNKVEELIGPGRKFSLTPEERRMNQDAAAEPEMDMFLNGTLGPVRLIDDDDESRALASNPNLLCQGDLEALFTFKGEEFASRLAGITHPATLQRLNEMAIEMDATIGQVAMLGARTEKVTPSFNGAATLGADGVVRSGVPTKS